MITLKDIRKVYHTSDVETVALDDINLTVAQGEFVAVMGPSGCGKSTLLNLIGMIDRPSSGIYEFGNTNIAGSSEAQLVKLRKRNLGFVFQSFNLIDDLRVEENVELPLIYIGLPVKQRRGRVREALELVGLRARARHRPSQLSGGEQQRVAVARAIVADPMLVLADEPTGNLDSKNGEDVMELLTLLNQQGSTIVMVTHSERDASYAGRIVHMMDGRIVEAGELARDI